MHEAFQLGSHWAATSQWLVRQPKAINMQLDSTCRCQKEEYGVGTVQEALRNIKPRGGGTDLFSWTV